MQDSKIHLRDKPHYFFAPEEKTTRRGSNPRPPACDNNLPKVSRLGLIVVMFKLHSLLYDLHDPLGSCVELKAGFLDPGGGGKKNTKQGDHVAGKKNNTNGSSRSVLDTSFPPLVDDSGIVRTQDPGMSSYANVTGELSRKALNFRTLFTPTENRIDVVVPVESIRAINERFANTACGFFLRKRSMDGLDAMLENGLWFICNNPLILKKWNLDVNLLKEDVGNVPVCVKLHGVPVTAFSEDGLSVIATKLALIEVRADVELKDNIVVAIPKLVGEGFYTCTVRVEYEWKPPTCPCCKVFGHVQDECPKNIDSDVVKNMKKPSQAPRGVPVGAKMGFKSVKQVY
ncbi:zinc finger, CCHC-type containing protein [Tanacetum coccineum]